MRKNLHLLQINKFPEGPGGRAAKPVTEPGRCAGSSSSPPHDRRHMCARLCMCTRTILQGTHMPSKRARPVRNPPGSRKWTGHTPRKEAEAGTGAEGGPTKCSRGWRDPAPRQLSPGPTREAGAGFFQLLLLTSVHSAPCLLSISYARHSLQWRRRFCPQSPHSGNGETGNK